MNGVAIGPNSRKNIEALKKADWLVVCDYLSGRDERVLEAPGTTPEQMKKIKTTVYRLPGAGFAEKDGTFVNSARWLQWKYAALPPPGQAKVDQEILARIFLKVRELYQKGRRQVSRSDPQSLVDLYTIRRILTRGGREGDQRQGARRSNRSESPA